MVTNFALFDLGTSELLIILIIVLLLFGSKKLPELSRSIGESVKEVRKGLTGAAELKDDLNNEVAKTKEALTTNKSPKP